MRSNFRKRLYILESETPDKFAGIDIDYLNGLEDYPEDEWAVVDFDYCFTILKNINTGQVQGVYADRRSDAEIKAMGGDLAYL